MLEQNYGKQKFKNKFQYGIYVPGNIGPPLLFPFLFSPPGTAAAFAGFLFLLPISISLSTAPPRRVTLRHSGQWPHHSQPGQAESGSLLVGPPARQCSLRRRRGESLAHVQNRSTFASVTFAFEGQFCYIFSSSLYLGQLPIFPH